MTAEITLDEINDRRKFLQKTLSEADQRDAEMLLAGRLAELDWVLEQAVEEELQQ